jgi:hypothetical protein
MLPIARRDLERLQQIMAIRPRLLDIQAPARAQRGVLHRSVIDEALTWLDIHEDRPDVVAHWRDLQTQGVSHQPQAEHEGDIQAPFRRRRRRRRRRRSAQL